MSPPATDRPLPIPAKAGIGLRFQHHQAVLEVAPDVAWMEVHTENYMGGGTPLRYLDAIRRDYPISLHGVGLSLGSAEGLDAAHIERMKVTRTPELLTVNGRAELVVQDAESYQALLDRLHRMETIAAIREGMASAERGELEPAEQVYAEMKVRYGLSG